MSARTRDELDDLLGALRDGTLDDAGAARLEALIADDADALDRYIHCRWIESGLMERFRERVPSSAAEAPVARAIPITTARRTTGAWRPWALAAAVVLLGAAAAIVWQATRGDAAPGSVEPDAHAPTVAVLIDAAGAQWGQVPLAPGAELSGQELRLDGGSIELTMMGGASVTLTGPAVVDLRDGGRCDLRLGRLHAVVPEQAVGFTVGAPRGVRVVDLGTAFTVDVAADGASRVSVGSGAVELWSGERMRRLIAGEALGVGVDGGYIEAGVLAQRTIEGVSVTGAARVPANVPDSVAGEATQSDEHLTLIPERRGVRLARALAVTITEPGEHTHFEDRAAEVPAGAIVDSVLVHFDPKSDPGKGGFHVREATLRLDRPVVGLIATSPRLAATDALLGAPGMKYGDTMDRHLESQTENQGAKFDVVELSADRLTLRLRFTANSARDQLRVLLAGAETPEASAIDGGDSR